MEYQRNHDLGKRDAETAFYQAENKKLTEEVSSLQKSVRAQNGVIAKLQKRLLES